LDNGADINQCSSDGRNALMWASAKGDIKTMELLIEKGANKEHEDSQGLNAFDLCVTK
jgi:ankyrin repeat protein